MGLPVVGWAYGPSAASLGASVVKTRREVKRAYGLGRLRKPDGAREPDGVEVAMLEVMFAMERLWMSEEGACGLEGDEGGV